MEAAPTPSNRLAVLASVRCLECGSVYAKPTVGGTNEMNPGCPLCGYVGWIPVRLALAPEARRRSAAGRPLRLAARQH
jgi:predicted  nucleic acid-binding Zn-ribbon protein